MRLTPTLPYGTQRLTRYDELTRYAREFAAGHFPFLLLLGEPGLGKSQAFTRALQDEPHLYVQTHATALGLYTELYTHRDEPVVIDDLDSLYAEKAVVRLLKCLCNTDPAKRLQWVSTSPRIGAGAGQTPAAFATSSSVCLITNAWSSANANVRALEDRAVVLSFEPDAFEVHRAVAAWFKEPEVLEFFGRWLPLITRPSIRHYLKAQQFYRAGREDWQALTLATLGVEERLRVLVSLQEEAALTTEAARVQAYIDRGCGSRATYFRLKHRLPPVDPSLRLCDSAA